MTEYKAVLREKANGTIAVTIWQRLNGSRGMWNTVPDSLAIYDNRDAAEKYAHRALRLLRNDRVISTWEIE